MEEKKEELITIAAWLHYEENKNHEEIAKHLNISRVSVTRMLKKARENGVVQFRITKSLPPQYRLEVSLKKNISLLTFW